MSHKYGHQLVPDRVPDVWAVMKDRCQGLLPHGLTRGVCVRGEGMDNKQQMHAHHQCYGGTTRGAWGALSEEVVLKLRPEGQEDLENMSK